jgi:hypothetical protein
MALGVNLTTVRHHVLFRSFPRSPARRISPLKLSPRRQGSDGDHLGLPSPRSTLQHAIPVVLEAVAGPLALFYVVLLLLGFRGALVAALVWSYLALVRRVRRGERISTLLVLGAALLTARTAVSFITGNPIVYFAQPMATAVVAALVLIGSAALGRPLTQRFVHDFCPIDPEFLGHPRVRQFFVRISLLWATVLLVNAGLTLWLLLSSPLGTFVLERTAATWGLTALAIFLSITWFVASMRKDGITVEWASYRQPLPVPVEID